MGEARWAIDIDRDSIDRAALVEEGEAPLAPGTVEVRLESFAMTASNVTYAALGKPVGLFGNGKGYWDFFSPEDGPGRVPVWGFARVARSAVEGIAPGELLYGYFPLASHAVLHPARAGSGGFVDRAPHRADMPPVYLQYQTLAALGDYDADDHDWWPVFRPLYLTGWLIADQLEDEGDHGAGQVIVAGASSKTAICFAHAMRARANRPEMVGLTSPRGRTFLEATGLYDRLVPYDDIAAAIDPARPAVFIDIAGNPAVSAAVHDRLGDAMRLSLIVGKAHWDAAPADGPRRKATGFFAPGRIEKRSIDWGSGGFRDRIAGAWRGFVADAKSLFRIDRRYGAEAALDAYREAVAGKADPKAGIVVAL